MSAVKSPLRSRRGDFLIETRARSPLTVSGRVVREKLGAGRLILSISQKHRLSMQAAKQLRSSKSVLCSIRVRSANTTARPFAERLTDIEGNPGNWSLESVHTETAVSRRAADGVSEQLIYRNVQTGETITPQESTLAYLPCHNAGKSLRQNRLGKKRSWPKYDRPQTICCGSCASGSWPVILLNF